MKKGNSDDPPFSSNDEPTLSGEESKDPLNITPPPIPPLLGGDLVLGPIGDIGTTEERNLTEHHSGHFREDPLRFMMQMGAFYQGTGWRSYKNYIGTRIFYEGYTEELKERVLNSERVLYMIAYLAEKQVNFLSQTFPNATPKMIAKRKKKFEKELQIVANGMVDKLIADLNSIRRGGAFFIRRTWGDDQLYGSIVKEYLECLLESGHSIECFIEGTRNWLKAAILAKGGRVKEFGGMSTAEIVNRAMVVLKDLIKERKDLLEPVFYAEKRFELSFYRNQQGGAKPTQRLDIETLLTEVEFLSQLLKGEFVYRPGEIKDNIHKTLIGLKNDNVFNFCDKYVELSDAERAIGRENYVVSLFSMTPTNSHRRLTTPIVNKNTNNKPVPITWFSERDFQNKCQLFGKTLYYQGDLSYFEAVNKETLKNAFIYLEDAGVIMPTIALAPDFVPTRNSDGVIEAKGELWNLVEKIGKFRREGKNRRDNATVSSRVLKLAEMVGTPTTADVDVITNLTTQPGLKCLNKGVSLKYSNLEAFLIKWIKER
ncbi:6406_t:CDS:10 [Racocetra fulgida]|uniref:6406_t:CDS:1 n=1 Tax=Racocetra fulgida TaxID=60492 RepID=A0A9N9B870_9GLOM|nr:6406_t:CDS:10 [Racocetra fulgida]